MKQKNNFILYIICLVISFLLNTKTHAQAQIETTHITELLALLSKAELIAIKKEILTLYTRHNTADTLVIQTHYPENPVDGKTFAQKIATGILTAFGIAALIAIIIGIDYMIKQKNKSRVTLVPGEKTGIQAGFNFGGYSFLHVSV